VHATGQLFLLELLARRREVREGHPVASKRFREALTEDHTDAKDAAGLALLARWEGDCPTVRFSASPRRRPAGSGSPGRAGGG
jgi:hypothetical protein